MSVYSIAASKFVNACDYVPIASTFKSLVSIFLRTMDNVLPESIKKTRIYEQLKNSPDWRSLVLLIPILGNIIIALYDYNNRRQSEALIKKAEQAKNPEEAFKLYEQAAHLGNGEAMFKLAECYAKAEMVPKNNIKAAEWYRKFGEHLSQIGDFEVGESSYVCADAQIYLDLIEKMRPDAKNLKAQAKVFHNPADLFKFYEEKAIKGDPAAMYQVADYYDRGQGIEKNPEKAKEWFKKADEACIKKYDQEGESKKLREPFALTPAQYSLI